MSTIPLFAIHFDMLVVKDKFKLHNSTIIHGKAFAATLILGALMLLSLASGPARAMEDLLIADSDVVAGVQSQDPGYQTLNPDPEEPYQGSTYSSEISIDPGFLQDIPDIPALTIDCALSLARSSNRNIRMAEQAVQLATAAGRSSLASYQPDLSLSYRYTRYGAAQVIELPDETEFVLQGENSFAAALLFNWPLYRGGQVEATTRATDAGIEVSEYQLRQAISMIDMGTVNAFCNARESFESLIVAQSSYDWLSELERQAQAMYDAGYMPLSDLLSVQVAKSEAHQQIIEWSNTIETSQSSLAYALGEDISHRWALVPIDYPIVENPFTLETLTEWAMENRPEIREIHAQREQILAQMDTIRGTRGPMVDFDATFAKASEEFTFSDSSDTLSGTVSIWWDLHDFGRTNDILAPLTEQLALLEIKEEDVIMQIRQEVEQAYLTLDTMYENVQVARQARDQAAEALRVANLRLEEGLAIMVEVLDAEATWSRLGARIIFTEHGYFRVLAMLSHSVGTSTGDMVALIEASGDSEQ